jgi:hypothetical protein
MINDVALRPVLDLRSQVDEADAGAASLCHRTSALQ